MTLRGEWAAAKAAAKGHEEGLAMDQQRMALAEEEKSRCTIKAERAALIVYRSTAEWKDTPDIAARATVYNDQVLLLMPDLTKMQVKVGIQDYVRADFVPSKRQILRKPQVHTCQCHLRTIGFASRSCKLRSPTASENRRIASQTRRSRGRLEKENRRVHKENSRRIWPFIVPRSTAPSTVYNPISINEVYSTRRW